MHTKHEKNLHRFCIIAVAILIFASIVGAIWHLSLYLFNADALDNLNHMHAASGDSHLIIWLFKNNALTNGFVFLGIGVFLLAAAIAVLTGLPKGICSQTVLPERRGALQIIRIFTGFTLLAIPIIYAVYSFYGFSLGKFQGNMNLAAMLLAVPACLYFLFPGITDRFSEFLQTLFGICFIGFTIFSLIVTHVYMFEGLTSPLRTTNLLSLVAMMLFILYEVRFLAAKPLPNLYIACAGLALYFCALNGLPRLVLTMIGEMQVSVQTMYACLEIFIAIYATCRLILFLSEWNYTLRKDPETDELPDTVNLDVPVAGEETIEPDYTEDSEIESPILEAAIDLALFDRAFAGMSSANDEALDNISKDISDAETSETDPLETLIEENDAENESNDLDKTDPLEELMNSTEDDPVQKPTEETDPLSELMEEADSTADALEQETQTADDRFAEISDELFGSKEEEL
ncbi:MAG: hypothetical protein E7616_07795 [Ruminococcaceae bacterium]|nr:hypothetical protein [Oscillospiraceae bacterium]